MLELGRILTAGGVVAAATGLILYGIVESQWETNATQSNISLALMIVGVIVGIIGVSLYRKTSVD